jgi:UDPglucose 6-dehydrogenase
MLRGVEFCKDAYDAAKGAHALVLVTEWNEFRRLDLRKLKSFMKKPVVIDCRNIYEPSEMARLGFIYSGVGRPEVARAVVKGARSPKGRRTKAKR